MNSIWSWITKFINKQKKYKDFADDEVKVLKAIAKINEKGKTATRDIVSKTTGFPEQKIAWHIERLEAKGYINKR